jgi:branched-chain amino acid transport system ATP-binding protein
VLKVEHLCAAYGSIEALRGVTFEVPQRATVAIVGPNGAGKTTLFKAISGVVPATAGSIVYEGRDLLHIAPHERARLGIAHVPEGRQVFKTMTVRENIEIGAALAGAGAVRSAMVQRVMDRFPELASRDRQLAGTLSGGQQQMLAIGRGLASAPRLLLLDEPSMGLSPVIADQIFAVIADIQSSEELTVVLVEQRVAEALEACTLGYILDSGVIVGGGAPSQLMQDERIRKAYLGL